MPSYVLRAQETAPSIITTTATTTATAIPTTTTTTITGNQSHIISPQRNLSLNLNATYNKNVQSIPLQKQQQSLVNSHNTTAMLTNVRNNVGVAGSNDSFDERALLLRDIGNTSSMTLSSTPTHQLQHTQSNSNNNNNNSFNHILNTKTKITTATTTTTNNNRNNYGSTMIMRNGDNDVKGSHSVGDCLLATDDDTLSDVVTAGTIGAKIPTNMDSDEANIEHTYSTRQNHTNTNTNTNATATATATTTAANKKTNKKQLKRTTTT